MTEQKRAEWVKPITQRLAQSRQEIAQLVSEVPADAWTKPSPYSGWSFKDQLSHLSESHRNVHDVMRAVIAGRAPDFSRFLRIDEINEENRQKHSGTQVDELRAAFIRESEETENIVSGLTGEHAEFRLGPMTLSQALQGFTLHDAEHLSQLRKALAE